MVSSKMDFEVDTGAPQTDNEVGKGNGESLTDIGEDKKGVLGGFEMENEAAVDGKSNETRVNDSGNDKKNWAAVVDNAKESKGDLCVKVEENEADVGDNKKKVKVDTGDNAKEVEKNESLKGDEVDNRGSLKEDGVFGTVDDDVVMEDDKENKAEINRSLMEVNMEARVHEWEAQINLSTKKDKDAPCFHFECNDIATEEMDEDDRESLDYDSVENHGTTYGTISYDDMDIKPFVDVDMHEVGSYDQAKILDLKVKNMKNEKVEMETSAGNKGEELNLSILKNEVEVGAMMESNAADADGVKSLPSTSSPPPALYLPQVVILDAGSQYGTTIASKLRELYVRSEVCPLGAPSKIISMTGCSAIIISGRPNSFSDTGAPAYDPSIFELGLPILGISDGMHLINKHFGGTACKREIEEERQILAEIESDSLLFKGLEWKQAVFQTHGDNIEKLGNGLVTIGTNGDFINAYSNEILKIYGLLFHPEAKLTLEGEEMLKNFLFHIAGISPFGKSGDTDVWISQCVEYIQETVKDDKVLVLASGGDDSVICAALLKKALRDDQIVVVHVDNGFLRKNDSDAVEQALKQIDIKFHVIRSPHLFFFGKTTFYLDPRNRFKTVSSQMLCHTTAPEEKRIIIHDIFMKVLENFIADLNLGLHETLLVEPNFKAFTGELMPNLVLGRFGTFFFNESELNFLQILREKGRIVEPLKNFKKDEVKQIGLELGLPADFVERHSLPDEGLAMRIICASEPFMPDDFTETQVILRVMVDYHRRLQRGHALLHRIKRACTQDETEMLQQVSFRQQYSSTLLPIQVLGVQGNKQFYSHVAAISANGDPVWGELNFLANLIPKVCPSVSRVCYLFGGQAKEPIFEITPTLVTNNVIGTLRLCDHVANQVLRDSGFDKVVSRMPVVLIPIHFGRNETTPFPSCQTSIVLRPFISYDSAPGEAALPEKHLPLSVVNEMVQKVGKVQGISRVLYDLTSHPSGIIEWE